MGGRKGEMCHEEKNKNKDKRNLSVFLTSGVIVAFVTGVFSLKVSYDTNEQLKDIETQKYQYNLQEVRYEKLQEELKYFSVFKVYDSKYIHRFDIDSEDRSIAGAVDMLHDSLDEFLLHLKCLEPYLSDDALEFLENEGVFDEEFMRKYELDIADISDDAEVNIAVKEHMELVNEEFENLSEKIVQAISKDIYKEYIPRNLD